MPSVDILSILFQGGVVGIFIWYALARDRRESSERDKRDSEWRNFLTGEQEQRKVSMQTGTDQVGALATAVSELVDAIKLHEEASQQRASNAASVLTAISRLVRQMRKDPPRRK